MKTGKGLLCSLMAAGMLQADEAGPADAGKALLDHEKKVVRLPSIKFQTNKTHNEGPLPRPPLRRHESWLIGLELVS